jgi:acyl-CoA synthetase (AMP-forming)/AMP-acid ligase II
MHLASLVDMFEAGFGDRVLLGSDDSPVNGGRLAQLARAGASTLSGYDAVVYVGENHPLLPVALLAAAWAGVPFVPVNYRQEDHRLNNLIARQPGALVLADERAAQRIAVAGTPVVFDEWLATLPENPPAVAAPLDGDAVAVVLFTSGTTSEPKSAFLRNRHLMSYLLGSVDFGAASENDAALIAVPPYHIAGIANMLSNLFAGRRLVYLRAFEPNAWLETVRQEGVTNAMVVPTMLSRIVDALGNEPANLPSLRSLSYGGAKVSNRVLKEALRRFPHTDFVNAYGLTETASTIAVLGPEDHRAAVGSDDPEIARRLSSAGQILPTVEIEIRDDLGATLPADEVGVIYVRGEQIAGEYASGSVLDADGWFCTRDRGSIDAHGYLYIDGRIDDTIIRGGENIAPAEIEQVLFAHPAVAEACVVGLPDEEWGQRIVAVVVLSRGQKVSGDELRDSVRRELRGSKTPDEVVFRRELPHTETGKLLRRIVAAQLSQTN